MSNSLMVAQLQPILEVLAGIDPASPTAAADLNRMLPVNSQTLRSLAESFAAGVEAGWLCDREGGGARFSRVAKASEETRNFSIDAVQMSGPGVWHRHTEGEIDLCFALEGEPKFDGHPAGWVVFPPGSDHVPTVTGGTMQILYFLPNGAVEWKRS